MQRLKRLISAIHRHSLWQVVVVYAGASWGILSVIDTLTGVLGLPERFPSFAAALLLVGLPIVLATAVVQEGGPGRGTDHVLEEKKDATSAEASGKGFLPPGGVPQFLTWRNAFLGGVAAFALWGLVAAGWLLLDLRPDGPPSSRSEDAAHLRAALAVMPFRNLTADETNAYFAFGLHDELLTQLSRVSALSLRGRTSVMDYAGSAKPGRQIAEELGVGVLLEGSVQVLGDRLRVSVQLVEAATDVHLWAETYDRTLDDAFGIQSDIAQQVVAAVGAALDRGERQALTQIPTADAEAYRLYLQGLDYYLRLGRLREDLEISQRLYERAIELDPDFALAHAAVSEVHGWMYWWRYDPSAERIARQRESAEVAVRLAPELPQAHLAMGLWHYVARRDWAAALDEYEIALRTLPGHARPVERSGYTHRRMGNWDQTYAAFERAIELDPRDADLFGDLGATTYRFTRRYPDAIRAFGQALALTPDLHWAAVDKGWTYVAWRGQLDTIRSALDGIPGDVHLGGELGSTGVQRAELLLLERDATGLLAHLESLGSDVLEAESFFRPKSLYEGWAHELLGNHAAARRAFEGARRYLSALPQELQDDWRVRIALGLALAGLGDRDQARREADWIRQSPVYRDDAFSGPTLAEGRARILARAGEVELALGELARLLAGPSWLSVHTLRLDPRWDPLRQHPRFQALLAEYADT
jgi:TolB-like protein/Flp pilus assembly protein TadD